MFVRCAFLACVSVAFGGHAFLAVQDPPATLDDVRDELVLVNARLDTVQGSLDILQWWAECGVKAFCVFLGVFLIHFLFTHIRDGIFDEFSKK